MHAEENLCLFDLGISEQVGISLGGIILGHYLVREGESAKVEAALLVSGKI